MGNMVLLYFGEGLKFGSVRKCITGEFLSSYWGGDRRVFKSKFKLSLRLVCFVNRGGGGSNKRASRFRFWAFLLESTLWGWGSGLNILFVHGYTIR